MRLLWRHACRPRSTCRCPPIRANRQCSFQMVEALDNRGSFGCIEGTSASTLPSDPRQGATAELHAQSMPTRAGRSRHGFERPEPGSQEGSAETIWLRGQALTTGPNSCRRFDRHAGGGHAIRADCGVRQAGSTRRSSNSLTEDTVLRRATRVSDQAPWKVRGCSNRVGFI